MRFRFNSIAVVVALVGISARCFGQIPFEPPQPPLAPAAPTTALTPQAQADVEWLTSYMLVNEGYRFEHLPALERSFEKMSPTQLHTLRQFMEQKHAMQIEQAATIRQLQAHQFATSAAYQQREQQALEEYNAGQSDGPNVGDLRLQQMKDLAEANERGDLIRYRNPPLPTRAPFGPRYDRAFDSESDSAE